ncbi:hypothetical protein Acy02nite_88090 [Actinoplanes cyaneus]|uniref:Uncharacterized protein n=1 Tax=Actinoplanes cyaneus TaxID=52696 RepID=A0A919MAV7_9ACTN|nr:hypothetical protein Acy02nite_88090 [Actinoplanes cyaneus]
MFAFDEFGPLAIRPQAGSGWAPKNHPRQLPANYHKLHGVRQFHGCYSVSTTNSGASCTAARAR